MINPFTSIKRQLRRFSRRDDGTASLEIVLVLPFFLMLFMSAYEGGMISMRHMMMERGLDMAVRDVRIGRVPDPEHEDLKALICDYAGIIPDCINQLQLEMIPMDVRDWTGALEGPIACIDRAEDADNSNFDFDHAGNNALMVLQVCTLFDPVVPTSGLGKYIADDQNGGAYALVASSAFVMEPFR